MLSFFMKKVSESNLLECIKKYIGAIVRIVVAIIVIIGGVVGMMPSTPIDFQAIQPAETTLMVRSNDGGSAENYRHRTFNITLDNNRQQKEEAIFIENIEQQAKRISCERGFFERLFGSAGALRTYVFSNKSRLVISSGGQVYFIKMKSSNPESALGELGYHSDSQGRYFKLKTVGASGLDIKRVEKSYAALEQEEVKIAPRGILGLGAIYNMIYSSVARFGWFLMPIVMLGIFSPVLFFYIVKMLEVRKAKLEIQYIKNDEKMTATKKKDRIKGIAQKHTGFLGMILQNIPVIVYYFNSSYGPSWCSELFNINFLWSRSVALAPCTSALWQNRFFQPTITGLAGVLILSVLFEIQQDSLQVEGNKMHWAMKIISVIAIYSWCNGASIGTVFSVVLFSVLWNLIAWVAVFITEQVQDN